MQDTKVFGKHFCITTATSRAVQSMYSQRRRQRYSLGSPVPSRMCLNVPLDRFAARQKRDTEQSIKMPITSQVAAKLNPGMCTG